MKQLLAASPLPAESQPLSLGPTSPRPGRAYLPPPPPLELSRYAFVFLRPESADRPASFIREAISRHSPKLHFEILPSSRGRMLLRFGNAADRDSALDLQPFPLDGISVELMANEDTSSPARFFRRPEVLALATVLNFPVELWTEPFIKMAFCPYGHVVEVDPICLQGYDYGLLRIVLLVNHPRDVPNEIELSTPNGLGGILQVTVIRTWDLAASITNGSYVPVFAPHRPPAHRSSPVHHQQQLDDFPESYFDAFRINFPLLQGHPAPRLPPTPPTLPLAIEWHPPFPVSAGPTDPAPRAPSSSPSTRGGRLATKETDDFVDIGMHTAADSHGLLAPCQKLLAAATDLDITDVAAPDSDADAKLKTVGMHAAVDSHGLLTLCQKPLAAATDLDITDVAAPDSDADAKLKTVGMHAAVDSHGLLAPCQKPLAAATDLDIADVAAPDSDADASANPKLKTVVELCT